MRRYLLDVDDAKSLYDDYARKGVDIWHKIDDKPWGTRKFGIITLDGHRIVFGQQIK